MARLSKSQAIKKNIQNKLQVVDNQVKLDLEKIFENAIDTVEDYQEEDVSGRQIKRNTSAWSDKINYLLDELPSDHPLRKSGNIQKLVNKLDSINAKPDNEVTYDVMVAGGKPPKVSKQRFWNPISNLLNQARSDVLKPSDYAAEQVSTELKPGHLMARQGQITKPKAPIKPADATVIPKKEKHQLRGGLSKAPSSQQVSSEMPKAELESGATPGIVVNTVLSITGKRLDRANSMQDILISLENNIKNLRLDGTQLLSNNNQSSIEISLGEIYENIEKLKNTDSDNKLSDADVKRIASDINKHYQDIGDDIDALSSIVDNVDVLSRKYQRQGGVTVNNNIRQYIEKIIEEYDRVRDEYDKNLSHGISDIIIANNYSTEPFKGLEQLVKFFQGINFDNLIEEIKISENVYDQSARAYSNLLKIEEDNVTYNVFMRILGDSKSSADIQKAIDRYIAYKRR